MQRTKQDAIGQLGGGHQEYGKFRIKPTNGQAIRSPHREARATESGRISYEEQGNLNCKPFIQLAVNYDSNDDDDKMVMMK